MKPDQQTLEKILISYLLNNRDLYLENHTFITPDLFTSGLFANILDAIDRIYSEGGGVSAVSLSMKTGISLADVTALYQAADYTHDFATVLDVLTDNAQTRAITLLCDELTHRVRQNIPPDEMLDYLTKWIQSKGTVGKQNISHISDGVNELARQIDINRTQGGCVGIPTGISFIDRFAGGLQNSDLIVVAGRTSQGKTSLALTFMYNSAMLGRSSFIVSLEMSRVQIAARLAAMATKIGGKHLLYGTLSEGEIEQFNAKVGELIRSNIYISDDPVTKASAIVNQIRHAKISKGIDMAVVDYLQLTGTQKKGQSVEQDRGETARMFKNLAKELNIPILLLSQLKRAQSSGDPAPMLHELRDSGQIEEAADMVMLVYRPEFYDIMALEHEGVTMRSEGLASLQIAKGRNIGTGRTIVEFDKYTSYFKDLYHATTAPIPF